jgi:hypothetical protein
VSPILRPVLATVGLTLMQRPCRVPPLPAENLTDPGRHWLAVLAEARARLQRSDFKVNGVLLKDLVTI